MGESLLPSGNAFSILHQFCLVCGHVFVYDVLVAARAFMLSPAQRNRVVRSRGTNVK